MKNVISLKVRILGSNLFLTREYVTALKREVTLLGKRQLCVVK
jgi:hypothetical protein